MKLIDTFRILVKN